MGNSAGVGRRGWGAIGVAACRVGRTCVLLRGPCGVLAWDRFPRVSILSFAPPSPPRTSHKTQPPPTRPPAPPPQLDSFVHLHLGIDATGLPPDLECHHLVVNSWEQLTGPQVWGVPCTLDKTRGVGGRQGLGVGWWMGGCRGRVAVCVFGIV